MKWTSYLAIAGVAASLAAMPVAAEAQDTDRAPGREQADSNRRMRGAAGHRAMAPGRAMMGPAERLLAQRTELNLSADQITRLEQIRDAYSAREKPYVDEMHKLRAERQEAQPRQDRSARRQRPELTPAARAAMDSLRASREAARKEAFEVLTEAQREQVQEMMKEQRQNRPREMRRMRDSAQVRGA